MADSYFIEDFTDELAPSSNYGEGTATKIVGISANAFPEDDWDGDFVFEDDDFSITPPGVNADLTKDFETSSPAQGSSKLPLPSPMIRKNLTRTDTSIFAAKKGSGASFTEIADGDGRGRKMRKQPHEASLTIKGPIQTPAADTKINVSTESLSSLKKLAVEVLRKLPDFSEEMSEEVCSRWKLITESEEKQDVPSGPADEPPKPVATVEEAKEVHQWQLNVAVEKKQKYEEAKSYFDLAKNLHKLDHYSESIFNIALAKSLLQKKKHKALKDMELTVMCFIASAEGEMMRELYNPAVDHLTNALQIVEEFSMIDLKAYVHFMFAKIRMALHMEMRATLHTLQYLSAIVELVEDPSKFKYQVFGISPFNWNALRESCSALGKLLHAKELDDLAKDYFVRAKHFATKADTPKEKEEIESMLEDIKIAESDDEIDSEEDWDMEFEIEDQKAKDTGGQLANLANLLKRQISPDTQAKDDADVEKRYQIFSHDFASNVQIVKYPQSSIPYGRREHILGGAEMEALLSGMVSKHSKMRDTLNIKHLGEYLSNTKMTTENVRTVGIHYVGYVRVLEEKKDTEEIKKCVKRFFKDVGALKGNLPESVFWIGFQLIEECMGYINLSSRTMQNALTAMAELSKKTMKGVDTEDFFEMLKLESKLENNSPLSEQGELAVFDLNSFFKKTAVKLANGEELLKVQAEDLSEISFSLEPDELKESVSSPAFTHPVHILAWILADVKLYVTGFRPLSFRIEKEFEDDFPERDMDLEDPDGLHQMSQEQQMTILQILYDGLPLSQLRVKVGFTLGYYFVFEASRPVLAEELLWDAVLHLNDAGCEPDVLANAKVRPEKAKGLDLEEKSEGPAAFPAIISALGIALLNALGQAYLANKKYVYSIAVLESEVRALWHVGRDTERAIRRLAVICSDNKDHKRALIYYFHIIGLAVRDWKVNEVIYICEIISGIYFNMGEFRSSELFLKYASRKSFPSFRYHESDRVDAQFLQLQLKLANVYIRSSRLEDAYELLVRLQRCTLPHGKPVLVLTSLAECLNKKRWFEACKRVLDKVEELGVGGKSRQVFSNIRSHDSMSKLRFLEVQAKNFRNGGHYFSAVFCMDMAISLCDRSSLKTLGKFYYLKGKILHDVVRAGTRMKYPTMLQPEDESIRAKYKEANNGEQKRKIINVYEMMEYAVECYQAAYSYFRSVMDDISIAQTMNRIAEVQLFLYASPVLHHGKSFRSVIAEYSNSGRDEEIQETEIDIEEKIEKMRQPIILALDVAADLCNIFVLLRGFANLMEVLLISNNRNGALSYWLECKNYLFSLFFVGAKVQFRHRATPALLEKIFHLLQKLSRALLCFETDFINTHLIVFDALILLEADLEAASRRSQQTPIALEVMKREITTGKAVPTKAEGEADEVEEKSSKKDKGAKGGKKKGNGIETMPFMDNTTQFGEDFYRLLEELCLEEQDAKGCPAYRVRRDSSELSGTASDDAMFTNMHKIQLALASYTSGGLAQSDVQSQNVTQLRLMHQLMREARTSTRKAAADAPSRIMREATRGPGMKTAGTEGSRRSDKRSTASMSFGIGTGPGSSSGRFVTSNNYVHFSHMEKRMSDRGTDLNVVFVLSLNGDILYYCPNTGVRRAHGFRMTQGTQFQGFKSLRGKLQNIQGFEANKEDLDTGEVAYLGKRERTASSAESLSISETSDSTQEENFHIFDNQVESRGSSSLTSDMVQLLASFVVCGREESAAAFDSGYRKRLLLQMKSIIFYNPVSLIPKFEKKSRSKDLKSKKSAVFKLGKKMNFVLGPQKSIKNIVLVVSPSLHVVPWESFFEDHYPIRSLTLMDYFKYGHVEVKENEMDLFDSALFFTFVNENSHHSSKTLEVARKDWVCDNTLWNIHHTPVKITYGPTVASFPHRVPYHSPLIKIGQVPSSKKLRNFEFVDVGAEPHIHEELINVVIERVSKSVERSERIATSKFHPIILISYADLLDMPPLILNFLLNPCIKNDVHVTVLACPMSHVKQLTRSLTKLYDYTIKSLEKKRVNLVGDLYHMLLGTVKTFSDTHNVPIAVFNPPVGYIMKT